jgi:hypothetical protein
MVASEHGAESRRDSEATMGTTKSKKRRSSLLSMARQSFVRSGGERGASVETLRGKKADFEGTAIVKRGDGDGVSCGCFGSSVRTDVINYVETGALPLILASRLQDSDEVLVLIKGPFLFVFKNQTSQSPKYAVPLAHLHATVKGEGHVLATHGYTSVNLETALGDVEYVVMFHTAGNLEVATTFANVVNQQAATGEADEVRKVSRRSSF